MRSHKVNDAADNGNADLNEQDQKLRRIGIHLQREPSDQKTDGGGQYHKQYILHNTRTGILHQIIIRVIIILQLPLFLCRTCVVR